MRAIAIALLAAAASRGLAKCQDDEKWRYYAGDKGEQGCKHVAELPAKRCDRVSDDEVSARYACCGTCAAYDCSAETKQPIFFKSSDSVEWDTCKKTCAKKDLAMPCITSKQVNKQFEKAVEGSSWLGYTTGGKDPKKLSNWKWRDGCESKYTNWDTSTDQGGEPNNWDDEGEYCARLWGDDLWYDDTCDPGLYCTCQNDDPCALVGKSGGKGGGKAPSKGKCKKDDKTWRDEEDGTTCKDIKKLKDKKARKKACKKLRGENADGEIVRAKGACCKKACK